MKLDAVTACTAPPCFGDRSGLGVNGAIKTSSRSQCDNVDMHRLSLVTNNPLLSKALSGAARED